MMVTLKDSDEIRRFDAYVNGEQKGVIELTMPVVDIYSWHGNCPSPFETVLGVDREQLTRIIYIVDGVKDGKIVTIKDEPDCIRGAEALQVLINKAGMDRMYEEAREAERLCMAQWEFLEADKEDEEEDDDIIIDDEDIADGDEEESEESKIAKRLLAVRRVIDAVTYLKTGAWKIKAITVIPAQISGILQNVSEIFLYGASHDISTLYERVIDMNRRLEMLIQLKAPDVILISEIGRFQRAVDSLYANEWLETPYVHTDGTPLMSLGSIIHHGITRF